MEYLEKICCFFIFARVFLHMCPNETYEKYLSALTSWVAFCVFLSPFLSGEVFGESNRMREVSPKTQLEQMVEEAVSGLEQSSNKAAAEIAKEMEESDEAKTDR